LDAAGHAGRKARVRRRHAWLARSLVWLVLCCVTLAACARGPGALETVPVGELPPEARQTIALIRAGGPFPYEKDGSVFANREGLLPRRARGYYREYTVSTPGRRDRGARRIVTGRSAEYYWTEDHYRSFRRVVEVP
jgi:ribonuclease T1